MRRFSDWVTTSKWSRRRIIVTGLTLCGLALHVARAPVTIDETAIALLGIFALALVVPGRLVVDLIGRVTTLNAFGVELTLAERGAVQNLASQARKETETTETPADERSSDTVAKRIELTAADCALRDRDREQPLTLLLRLADRGLVDPDAADTLRVSLEGRRPSEGPLALTFAQAERTAIETLRPRAFARAVADRLRRAGFEVDATGAHASRRVDLVATRGPETWLVECKLALERESPILQKALKRLQGTERRQADQVVVVVPDRSRTLEHPGVVGDSEITVMGISAIR